MTNSNYSSDSPVSIQNQDKFSRWTFSQRVADVISKRSDPNSIAIGLYGPWGDGKTSVMNFIQHNLEESEVICINFNPWRFGTEEELLTGFFFDLADALDTKLKTKTDSAKGMFKTALPALTSLAGAKGVGEAATSYIKGPTLIDFKKRIENALEVAEKKVLILIDDVDRLEKSEIHSLFRLVKLTADFKHTSYILAFDKDIVSASLQERYSNASGNAGEAFLEKIIQVPLHLPSIEKHILRQYCFDGVNEALRVSEIELTEQQVQDFIRDFGSAFDSSITTPRKAMLYSNTLLFSLPILKGEVNPVDLMKLEGLRIFYPDLYDFIRHNRDIFLNAQLNGIYDDKENKKLIKEAIDKAIGSDCNELTKKSLVSLMTNLFPKLQAIFSNVTHDSGWEATWAKAQRACSNAYFSRYFTYAIPLSDIPDQAVIDFIENSPQLDFSTPNDEIEHPISTENSATFIRKISLMATEMTEEQIVATGKILSRLSHLFPNSNSTFKWDEPFARAARLLSDLAMQLDGDKRKSVLLEYINESPSIDFMLEIKRWLPLENPEQPEKVALPLNEINDISQHIAEKIRLQIDDGIKINELTDHSLVWVIETLNSSLDKEYLDKYYQMALVDDAELLVVTIKAFCPKGVNLNSGTSIAPNLRDKDYQSLISEINEDIFVAAINTHYPEIIFDSLPENYPSYNDNDEENTTLIKQFLWHKKAEAAAEPAAEPVAEPAAEPVAEPAAEPVAEPAAEAVAEPAAEPVAEPAAEAVAEPVAEAAAEAVAETK